MFIDDLLSSGAIPSLEMTFRFAGERQKLINHNIANLETPGFRPMDVSTDGFQRTLAQAIDKRREASGGMFGALEPEDTREVQHGESGTLTLTPRTGSGSILFHDRTNRDIERQMQANAENALVYRMASDMLRGRYQQLRDAIAERV
jgi:flagellar basal-body rod protein FlgB